MTPTQVTDYIAKMDKTGRAKRKPATFSLDQGLVEQLRQATRLKDIEQSDAVEWGIREWLQRFGEAHHHAERGRPVYVVREYETVATLAQILQAPHGPVEEAFVKYVKAIAKSGVRDGDG